MKRFRFVAATILALFAFAALCGGARAAEKPAAAVIKVTGKVIVQRGGKQKQITGGFALMTNDKLLPAKGASALLLFANGRKLEVKSDFTVTADAATAGGKKTTAAAGAAGMLMDSLAQKDKNADLKAKGGVGGAVRATPTAGPPLRLLTCNNTATLDTTPEIAWEPPEWAEKTLVTVTDENGDEIWSAETDKTSLAWPDDAPPLEPGVEYNVELTAVADEMELPVFSTCRALEEEEAERVKAAAETIVNGYPGDDDDRVIRGVLLAGVYEEAGLHGEAAAELRALIEIDARDVEAHRRLADIYRRTSDLNGFKKEMLIVGELEAELGAEEDF